MKETEIGNSIEVIVKLKEKLKEFGKNRLQQNI